MGKVLALHGAIDIDRIRFGVIDFNLNKNRTKVDVSDPQDNNNILLGRETWIFSATILKEIGISIDPPDDIIDIDVVLGDEAYLGRGTVFSVNEVFRTSQAVVYNIQGEFVSGTHTALITASNGVEAIDGFFWFDADGDLLGDDWTKYHAGLITDGMWGIAGEGYLRSQTVSNVANSEVGIYVPSVTYETGADYTVYVRYRVTTAIAGFHQIELDAGVALVSLNTSVGNYTYQQVHTALSTWNTARAVLWGDVTFPAAARYYTIAIGKEIDTLN